MKTGLERIGIILLAIIITAVIMFFRGSDQPSDVPADIAMPQNINIPESVMNYSACPHGADAQGNCLPDESISCYTGDQYAKLLKEQYIDFELAATALLDNHEHLEIYMAQDNGDFIATVLGPDSSGQEEACIVSSGTSLTWHILDDRQIIFTADPSSLPAVETAPAPELEPMPAAETPPAP